MIEITKQQHDALHREEGDPAPIQVLDPADNEQYVLVPLKTYEQLKNALSEEGSAWAEAGLNAAMQVFFRDGWDDPRMDVYDQMLADEAK